MKITGSVEIQVIDSKTSKVKQIIKQSNLITNKFLRFISSRQLNNALDSRTRIFISNSLDKPIKNIEVSPSVLAQGYIPSGVTSPRVLDNANPPYVEIQNRIDFTRTERTFYTIGLQRDNTSLPLAYLLLDTPCVQGAFDILDLFYRVQVQNTEGEGFFSDTPIAFTRSLADNSFYYFHWNAISPSICNAPLPIYDYKCLWYGRDIGVGYPEFGSSRRMQDTSVPNLFKFKSALNSNLDQDNGVIFNTFARSTNRNAYVPNLGGTQNSGSLACFTFPSDSPFQNGFTHSASATVPFFDSLKLAQGSGKVYLSGNWSGKYPEFYRITITADGATGTSKYRWSVRNHVGFAGNTYNDAAVPSLYMNPVSPIADDIHGWRQGNNDRHRWSDTQIVQYDDTGVTLLDVINGEYLSWSTPELPVTQARQVAVDPLNQKIYVGCRVTGIWVIDVAADTITHPIAEPCYGIDVGRNAVAFAFTSGGLRKSPDWATVPFVYADLASPNQERCKFLKVDPENINDQLALMIQAPNAANRRIVWFSSASANAITGYENSDSNDITVNPSSLDVSDSGSFWASRRFKFTYGTSVITFFPVDLDIVGNVSNPWGAPTLWQIEFYENSLITRTALISKENTVLSSYSYINGASIIHFKNGIVLYDNNFRQLLTDNTYCWRNYGWDGMQWVLNDSRDKTTHADEQLLLDGVTIRFADGANAPHFIATDFYTQGVCNGILKDNVTTLFYEDAWYTVPAQFDVPLPSGLTVPSSPTNPVPAPVRYWRVKKLVEPPQGARGWVVRELVFKDSNSVAIPLVGAAIASQFIGSDFASNAFDNNNSTWWNGGLPTPIDSWIGFAFTNPTIIYQVSMTIYNDGGSYIPPSLYSLDYSSDGITWKTAFRFSTGTNNTQTYNITIQYNTAYELRLLIADDPNFISLENDSVKLHKFKINDADIATLYLGGSIPPAPNEVRLWGDGYLEFNTADAGKTVTGTYAFVRY